MPNITLLGGHFNIKPLEEAESYLTNVAKAIGSLSEQDLYMDIIIHCKNKVTLKASKIILSYCSSLLKEIFFLNCECPSSNYLQMTYELICPEFDPDAMKIILELISTGKALISNSNISDIKEILHSLQMNTVASLFTYFEELTLDKNTYSENTENEPMFVDMKNPEPEPVDLQLHQSSKSTFLGLDELDKHEMRHKDENTSTATKVESSDHSTSNQCQICKKVFLKLEDLLHHFADCCKSDSLAGLSKVKSVLTNINDDTAQILNKNSLSSSNSEKDQLISSEVTDQTIYKVETDYSVPKDHDKQIKNIGKSPTKRKFISKEPLISSISFMINTQLNKRQPSKKSRAQQFKCHICQHKTYGISNLYGHFALSHFNKKLMAQYSNKDNTCTFCERKFGSKNGHIQHLVTSHHVLKDRIPEKEALMIHASPVIPV